jgi:predicted RNA-binding protein with TRAM domain
VQGFIIFIENGKVGNKIKVMVTEVADRFAKATMKPNQHDSYQTN